MKSLKEIIKLAKKTKKDLEGKTDLLSIVEYVQNTLHHEVRFEDFSKNVLEWYDYDGFHKMNIKGEYLVVFVKKGKHPIIFINTNTSPEDKRLYLYHQMGHILLGHYNYPQNILLSYEMQDLEADVFAFALLDEDGNE